MNILNAELFEARGARFDYPQPFVQFLIGSGGRGFRVQRDERPGEKQPSVLALTNVDTQVGRWMHHRTAQKPVFASMRGRSEKDDERPQLNSQLIMFGVRSLRRPLTESVQKAARNYQA